MSVFKLRSLALTSVAVGMLALPATSRSGPILDWLCGNSTNMTSQTTYVAPYYAPAYEGACAAPCSSCAGGGCSASYVAPASGCSSCSSQVVQYAPYTTYRPISVARSATTYYYPGLSCATCAAPRTTYYPSACNSCATPVTAYYPTVTAVRPHSLIPYATYRRVYMPTTYYVGYAAAPSACCASPSCSTCGTLCSSGTCGCGATCQSSSCSSCQGTISSGSATLSPTPASTPNYTSAPLKTFQQDQKPAAEDTKPTLPKIKFDSQDNSPSIRSDLKPIPQNDTHLNSMPAPRLIDPDNRTTSAPVRQALHLAAISSETAQASSQPSTGNWRESQE